MIALEMTLGVVSAKCVDVLWEANGCVIEQSKYMKERGTVLI